ncbi:UDP-4-amino-4,6-dideoxy-N-acetyl-beta-L-altrosamine transaminase [Halobacillus sp. H74]|uniref:UDP-4-amino-4, 6-dideoxy-N-acetyl-beta-L-altrosamine transaminase n=1 Tax=Halobacillus sp. H74 TaxID=3457436 RepID=UPI003FCDCB85
MAIFGGKPVRDTLLPYGSQWIDEKDIEAVVATLQSDFITTGPTIERFERKLSDYVGSKYAVAFSNGTAALHAACFAAGITDGDEVITTPLTFAASANCVLYMGGKPVFADVDPNTYNIDPVSVESLVTGRTKAIIPVDFTGQPADYEQLQRIADDKGLVIIEDAAHALGADFKGKKVGSFSDMTMFSFHPVKHITTGEGGAITTNNPVYYEKLKLFRTHGITRDVIQLEQERKDWEYEMQCLGMNYRLTDIQAALGVSQLKKLAGFVEKRKEYARQYTKAFEKMDHVAPPFQMEGSQSSWHLYIIRLNGPLAKQRTEVFHALRAENIGVNVHYMPVHTQPYYQRLGYSSGACPIAESIYEQVITLPLFPKMTKGDVRDVIRAVKKVVTHYEKEAGV